MVPQKSKKMKDFFVSNYDSDRSMSFDSDFEILSEDDEELSMQLNISYPKNQLQIRHEELVDLNCKTSLVPDKWNTEMNHFYTHIEPQNLSITAADLLKDDSGAEWELGLSDRYKTRNRNRYFLSKGRCTNCSQPGHYFRQCPEPIKKVRCSMCGIVGHRDQRCPSTCCLGCGNPDDYFRNTCHHCKFNNKKTCKECGYHGHKKQTCPDLWRRFHNTVPQVQLIDADSTEPHAAKQLEPRDNRSHKKPSEQWCCNCGRRGHLVDGCRRRQYSEYPVRPVSVQNYSPVPSLHQESDDEKPRSKKKKEKKRKENFHPESTVAPPSKKRRKTYEGGNPFQGKFNVAESFSRNNLDEPISYKKKQTKQRSSAWISALDPIPSKKRKNTNGAGKLLSKQKLEKKKNFQGHFAHSEDHPIVNPKNRKHKVKNSKKEFKELNPNNPYIKKFKEKKDKSSKKKIKMVFSNPQFKFAKNGDLSYRKNTHVRF